MVMKERNVDALAATNSRLRRTTPLAWSPESVVSERRLRGSALPFGSRRLAARKVPAPIGRLIRNIDGQPNESSRRAPNTEAGVWLAPTGVAIQPSAAPRSLLGKDCVRIAGPTENIMAAPTAWTTRRITRASSDQAADRKSVV